MHSITPLRCHSVWWHRVMRRCFFMSFLFLLAAVGACHRPSEHGRKKLCQACRCYVRFVALAATAFWAGRRLSCPGTWLTGVLVTMASKLSTLIFVPPGPLLGAHPPDDLYYIDCPVTAPPGNLYYIVRPATCVPHPLVRLRCSPPPQGPLRAFCAPTGRSPRPRLRRRCRSAPLRWCRAAPCTRADGHRSRRLHADGMPDCQSAYGAGKAARGAAKTQPAQCCLKQAAADTCILMSFFRPRTRQRGKGPRR